MGRELVQKYALPGRTGLTSAVVAVAAVVAAAAAGVVVVAGVQLLAPPVGQRFSLAVHRPPGMASVVTLRSPAGRVSRRDVLAGWLATSGVGKSKQNALIV